MKHPALTRVLAIVLVILCLTMGFAGGFGLSRAEKDLRAVRGDLSRLEGRIADYEAAAAALSGTESYASRSETLDEKQEQHDKDSAAHRGELATYTTTQYGLKVGTEAIDQADLQYAQYAAQFDQAMGTYQTALDQVNGLLAQLWQVYYAAAGVITSANPHLAAAQGLAGRMDTGAGLTYGELAGLYGEAVSIADEAYGLIATVQSLIPAFDALAAFDPSTLTSLTAGMGSVPGELAALGVDIGAGGMQTIDPNQFTGALDTYKQYWAAVRPTLAALGDITPQLDAMAQQATGMTVQEMRVRLQSAQEALYRMGDVPLEQWQNDIIFSTYYAYSGQIHQTLNDAYTRLSELNTYITEAYTALSSAQEQVNAMGGLMAQVRQMMAEGAEALYNARAMIWWQMGQQKDKEEELRESKEKLDLQADELEQLGEAAEDQKTREQKLRSVRAILLSRDGIRELVDAGQEPDAAARSYAEQRAAAAEKEYDDRRLACLLMLAGAGLGLIGIPAAFEQLRSRFLLLAPVLLCLGCAAAAEWVLYTMGRGHSYSALAVVAFALLQLLVSAPKKKRKVYAGRHLG